MSTAWLPPLMIHSLPDELLLAIVKGLKRADLLGFASVSTRLYNLCLPNLFETVTLQANPDNGYIADVSFIRHFDAAVDVFLNSEQGSNVLSHLVRYVEIRFDGILTDCAAEGSLEVRKFFKDRFSNELALLISSFMGLDTVHAYIPSLYMSEQTVALPLPLSTQSTPATSANFDISPKSPSSIVGRILPWRKSTPHRQQVELTTPPIPSAAPASIARYNATFPSISIEQWTLLAPTFDISLNITTLILSNYQWTMQAHLEIDETIIRPHMLPNLELLQANFPTVTLFLHDPRPLRSIRTTILPSNNNMHIHYLSSLTVAKEAFGTFLTSLALAVMPRKDVDRPFMLALAECCPFLEELLFSVRQGRGVTLELKNFKHLATLGIFDYTPIHDASSDTDEPMDQSDKVEAVSKTCPSLSSICLQYPEWWRWNGSIWETDAAKEARFDEEFEPWLKWGEELEKSSY